MDVETVRYCSVCRENDHRSLVRRGAEYLCFECAAAYNVASEAVGGDLTLDEDGHIEASSPGKSEPVLEPPKRKRGRPRKNT